MTALYDADRASNWQNIYTGSFVATYPQGKQIPVYTPIPIQELAFSTGRSLLAIYCTSEDYPDKRKYLGRVVQAVANPGNLPGSISTGRSISLYSNQTVLGDFTKFDDVYSLILHPKYTVEQLSISVFEYIGSEFYEVEARLNIIEGKIDQLL